MAETCGYRSISTGVATLGAVSDGTVEMNVLVQQMAKRILWYS